MSLVGTARTPSLRIRAVATHDRTLSREQVERYHGDGYLGPFTLCSPAEMAAIRERIDNEVIGTWNEWPGAQYQTRHLDCRVVYELCAHAAILDRVACILGPDLVLWQSNFFMKEPGEKEYPWHQDANYWPIEPPINVSAWIAIDPATVENGCVQVIPGSHRKHVPHIPADAAHQFPEQADPEFVDADKAVYMELEAGQFFLFSERMLHHSDANRSDRPRTGLAVRLTVPIVRCYHEHPMIVVRGSDRMGFNRMAEPPAQATRKGGGLRRLWQR